MKTTVRNGKSLRLGLAQVDSELGNVRANIDKAVDLVGGYRGKVDILLFPELALTGYSVGEDFHRCALRLDSTQLERLAKHTNGITVAMGLIEETRSFKFYNSLVFMRDGKIVRVHRKIYLPNYGIFEEKKYFSSGTKYATFSHEPFRIGPFICGDAWDPALVHLAAADEANLFLFSACSPDYSLGNRLSNRKNWYRLARFYAIIYGSFVAFVNRTGSERGLHFYGRSLIMNPFGEVVAASRGNKEEVVIGAINLSLVRKARTVLHTIRDENLDFIARELKRVIGGAGLD